MRIFWSVAAAGRCVRLEQADQALRAIPVVIFRDVAIPVVIDCFSALGAKGAPSVPHRTTAPSWHWCTQLDSIWAHRGPARLPAHTRSSALFTRLFPPRETLARKGAGAV